MPSKLTPQQEMARRTRRGFLGLGAGAVVAAGGWQWLTSGAPDGDIPPALRRVLQWNERVVRGALYSNKHLVKTYPASAIGKIKVNGEYGLDDAFVPDEWTLEVMPHRGGLPLKLSIEDVRGLPRHEETFDFKCVEGWSTVTQFAGARFSDFLNRFTTDSGRAQFVAMSTPDGEYYVGLDMPSAMHPQTLLAWEMNGQPLEDAHGAPLRLVIPVKYGIKNIKRIGRIAFGDTEPPDYWRERGYDFFAGL